MKYHLVSLGCSKALVDSELMLGGLARAGHELVPDPAEAELLLVNTCGFLREAAEESIETALELARYKSQGNCRHLVMVGCLPQRYAPALKKTLPEVDAFVGTGEFSRLPEVLRKLDSRGGNEVVAAVDGIPARIPLGESDRHYRYLKISEGCDHACTFCAIPGIRGKHRSRPIEDLVIEAARLADEGAREIILIAQDSTYYGMDLYGKKVLHELLARLAQLEKVAWIRLLYAYPNQVTPELLAVMAREPKICKYVDMPLQHCNRRILAAMERGGSRESLKRLVGRMRERVPGLAIRTTFIVGFPGETEEEFRELAEFVEEMRFERMGVFPYSREEGTPAGAMPDQVHWKTKRRRQHVLMELQAEIAARGNASLIGHTLPVMVDGRDPATDALVGRTEADAPEIDQSVHLLVPPGRPFGCPPLLPGSIVSATVVDAQPYDLVARVLP